MSEGNESSDEKVESLSDTSEVDQQPEQTENEDAVLATPSRPPHILDGKFYTLVLDA